MHTIFNKIHVIKSLEELFKYRYMGNAERTKSVKHDCNHKAKTKSSLHLKFQTYNVSEYGPRYCFKHILKYSFPWPYINCHKAALNNASVQLFVCLSIHPSDVQFTKCDIIPYRYT